MEEGEPPHFPLDIFYQIPKYISDPASLARVASSCKLWRGVIKDPAFLDGLKTRHLNHGFTSSLLLGFFYQDSAEAPEHLWQHHEDKTRCMAPRFTPMSELLPFTGCKEGYNSARPLSLDAFIQGIGSSLNFYEPVASQDSFLVLCRHSKDTEGQPMPDVVRICNPLSGEVFHLPDLPYKPPDHYALLVTDDDSLNGHMTQSFRLVPVWIEGKKFVYLYYCSKTSDWWRPSSFPELMAGLYPVSSPAAACHCCIHWFCGRWKSLTLSHVVTLHVDGEELSYLELPSEVKRNKAPLLGNSADGGLLLLLMNGLHMSLWKHKNEPGNGSSDWVRSETIDMTSSLPMRVLKMPASAKVRLEIFRGKSGLVVLWIEGEGLFLFSLSDGSMRKIDNENVTKKYRFCPYEIDWLSCLAVTNLVIDCSLSFGAQREKAQHRWRTFVAKNIPKRINA